MFEPFKRLKWGFLPVERIVEDDPEDEQASSYEDPTVVDEDQIIEYRDEANHRWYHFFDEYEYRLNKYSRNAHKWYKWFDDRDTPEERKLLWKIDLTLTLYSLAAYWVKYLDQTNLNNAYVGGLGPDIGMKGNDLVHTQVMFTVGNIIFQIPFMYVLNGLPLNYVLPILDLCWLILTIGTSKVNTVGQLKTIRFFIGAFEAPSYLAYQFMFGTFFFRPDQIARRSMVYYFGQYLGILTSGLLSGSIMRSLDGTHGLAAWRWIFIIDGIISLVIGVIGFYMLPGTSSRFYSIFFTDDEIRLLRRRLKKNHVAAEKNNVLKNLVSWKVWKSIFTSWEIYVLSLWDIFCWNNNNGTSGAYLIWLQSLTKTDSVGKVVARFDKGRLQDLGALTPGLGLLWLILTCTYADLFHSRWLAIVWSQVFNILGNVILAVWHVPEGAKWFAFCLQYFGWAMAPVLYSWQNDICRRDGQKRAVILVSMNMLAQSTTAWTLVLVWKTVDKPRYFKGFTFTASSALALSVWTFVVLYFYRRQEKKYAKQNGIVLYNSNIDPGFLDRVEAEKTSDGDSKSDSVVVEGATVEGKSDEEK